MVYALLQRARNKVRYELKKKFSSPIPTTGRMAVRDRHQDAADKLTTSTPVIVDAGGHTGDIAQIFLESFPQATIHLFEPNPVLVRGVEQRFATNDRMHIYQKALGSRDEPVEFNVLNYAPSSSILAPDAINHKYHGDKMDIAQKIQVDMCRLDSVIDTDIDIYKLDLQGYELAALEGSVALLPRTKIILTEIEFASLYQSQPLFGDIDVFLRAQGFFLFNLYDLFTHPDGQLTAGDAMYLNSRFYKQ